MPDAPLHPVATFWLGVIDEIIKLAAVFIGAFWTLFNFRKSRTYNQKLDIANTIELATTEMQGAQRGLMLAYEAKDAASAPQYIQIYRDSAKKNQNQGKCDREGTE